VSEEIIEKRGRPARVTPKVAPKITFESVFGDDRMRMEKEHDAESPEFKHMWMSKIDVDKEAPKRGGEVVAGVEHGNDVLVKIPMDVWQKRRDIETERSYQMASKARGQSKDESYSTGNLKQFARPVRTGA
jgi:hypothetical protein